MTFYVIPYFYHDRAVQGKEQENKYEIQYVYVYDPLRWPRNTLYPQKLVLLRQEAAVARSA
jgi:C1A family cysteine protease